MSAVVRVEATTKASDPPLEAAAPSPALLSIAAAPPVVPMGSRGRTYPPSLVSGAVAALDALCVLIAAIPAHWALVYAGAITPFQMSLERGAVVLGCGVLVLSLRAAGLHSFAAAVNPRRNSAAIVFVCFTVMALMGGAAWLVDLEGGLSLEWAIAWAIATAAMLVAGRFAAAAAIRDLARRGRVGRRIVVYGTGAQAERVLAQIQAANDPWNRVVAVFDDRVQRTPQTFRGLPVMGNLSAMILWARQHDPDEILVALPWGAEHRVMAVLRSLAVLPANVRLVPEFSLLDSIAGTISNHYGMPMLDAYRRPMDGWGRLWKRGFDLLGASLLLLLLSPALAFIALLIKLESPGPVLFKQPRFGFNQRLIEVYKFRSMRVACSDRLGERLTQRSDPRVTRVGAVLRKTSLDELPQLLNVIKAQMSLVGPRPHAVRTTAGGRQCDEVLANYAARHRIKPGITGWAQVNGWRGTMEDEEHLHRRVEHDMYYMNNWSPLFDIRILVQTLWVVFRRNSAY
jgi:Undecaprenyl-phosphate glucose phosphotransferase